VLSHVTLGTNDLDRAMAFYDRVLEPLGIVRTSARPEYGYAQYQREGEEFSLFICSPYDGRPATWGNGTHVALLAPDAVAVDAFHAAALAAGGLDEGEPGPRPHYHEGYYGAYVRDLDGNKLQACVHTHRLG
jgi:catechol 2,3-dioxygenase-like lactoylglutathione lyase family enzyme